MKVAYNSGSIHIIPECAMDEVYLEAALGLRAEGDTAHAVRVAPIGFRLEWAYLEIRQVQRLDE